jgi:hypothetical protein
VPAEDATKFDAMMRFACDSARNWSVADGLFA